VAVDRRPQQGGRRRRDVQTAGIATWVWLHGRKLSIVPGWQGVVATTANNLELTRYILVRDDVLLARAKRPHEPNNHDRPHRKLFPSEATHVSYARGSVPAFESFVVAAPW
jgi:hypothetical protein